MGFVRQQFDAAHVLQATSLEQMFVQVFGTLSTQRLLQYGEPADRNVFWMALQMFLVPAGGQRHRAIDVQLTLAVNYVKSMIQGLRGPRAAQDGLMREMIRDVDWPVPFRKEVYERLFDQGTAHDGQTTFSVYSYDLAPTA